MKVTLVPEQIAPDGFAEMLTLTGRLSLTDIVMLLDVAGFPVAHASLDVSSQVTTSPLVSVVLVKVGLFVPAFVPFTFH